MIYRMATKDDWPIIERFFRMNKWPLPHPNVAEFSIAEKDGEIVGFLCQRLVLYTGPIWTKEDAGVDYKELWTKHEERWKNHDFLPVSMVTPVDEKTEEMARNVGFELLEGAKVMRKWHKDIN